MQESPLKKEISEAMKSAMRAKDKARLGAIRLALAEIKRIEVDERIDPDDSRIITVLDKMIKQRRESIKHFEAAKRAELVAQEQVEIDILQEFLPQPISEEELDTLISEAMSSSGADGMRDMGKVMALLKPQLIGRADMSLVSNKIKSSLSWFVLALSLKERTPSHPLLAQKVRDWESNWASKYILISLAAGVA